MIQVMKFGVVKIVSGEEVLRDQSYKAHKYYNALIELELAHRTRYREIRAAFAPELVACEAEIAKVTEEIDAIYAEVKKARWLASKPEHPGDSPTPTKVPSTPEQDARLKELRARRKELSESAKVLRAEFSALLAPGDEAYDIRTSGITQAHAQEIKNAKTTIKILKSKKIKKDDPEMVSVKAHLADLLAQKKTIAPSTHKKGEANRRVLAEMLEEPTWPQVWKDIATLNADKGVQTRALRAACGLSSGTYAAVEAAFEQACIEAEGDPGFRRWERGRAARKVGKQITKTFLASQFMSGGGGPVRAEIVGRHRPESKGNRARGFQYLVSIDLGKGLGTVIVKCIFHRPVPADARIRWIYLVPELKPDGKWKWSLQLTLELSKPLIERAPGPKGSGTLHVDFRWSLSPERGLVVALLKDQGTALQSTALVTIDPKIVDSFEFARRVQGHADEHFNVAREALMVWMSKNPSSVPEWLIEETEHIAKWRSHEKLAHIVRQWVEGLGVQDTCRFMWGDWRHYRIGGAEKKDLFCSYEEASTWLKKHVPSMQRLSAEESFVVWLDWWRRKDAHLQAMANGTRTRTIRARKDFFQTTAARLCTQYERVEFGPLEIYRAAKRKTVDKDYDELHQAARRQRQWAAPGSLKEALVSAFGRERSSDVKKAGTSRNAESPDDSPSGAAVIE